MQLVFTTDELNAAFREDVGDPLEGPDGGASDGDCLWKNKEVYRYMSLAVDKLAKDTEGLYRIVQTPVTTGEQIVRLSPSVLHIREIRVLSTGLFLTPANINQAAFRTVDDYGVKLANGAFSKTGPLSNYIRDYQKSALILVPIPAADDALEIQYTATGVIPMDAGFPVPFTDAEDQYLLLCYMKKLAYEKSDAETYNKQLSKEWKEKYDEDVSTRKVRLESYRRTPGQVQMDWD